MSRHDRRVAKAQARRQFPELDLRPGMIAVPIPGMVDWGPDGKSRGVWGRDKPLCYVQFSEDGGSCRPLTKAESRFVERIYGPPSQPKMV
ncbi:hypothetical protein [Roseivivax marinus]|uniref:hypothetical protein n=1 Tax=Roseivivax marinus TaxID=1379903 RepID=UPI00273F1236|nr:hypothetical protein [Roseivivax marinus]